MTAATDAYGLLDRLEDRRDVVCRSPGPQQDVHVFRHEPIGPNRKVVFTASGVDRIRQPRTGTLGVQKAKAALTGKRQLMSMPWDVGGRPTHASFFPVHERWTLGVGISIGAIAAIERSASSGKLRRSVRGVSGNVALVLRDVDSHRIHDRVEVDAAEIGPAVVLYLESERRRTGVICRRRVFQPISVQVADADKLAGSHGNPA